MIHRNMLISLDRPLCLVLMFPLFVATLVLALIVMTCYQARKVRDSPRDTINTQDNSQLADQVRNELDDKYSSIP